MSHFRRVRKVSPVISIFIVILQCSLSIRILDKPPRSQASTEQNAILTKNTPAVCDKTHLSLRRRFRLSGEITYGGATIPHSVDIHYYDLPLDSYAIAWRYRPQISFAAWTTRNPPPLIPWLVEATAKWRSGDCRFCFEDDNLGTRLCSSVIAITVKY